MKREILLVSSALSLLAPSAVFAQAATTKVVGTCGTQTYTAGKMQYPTQDTTGNACSTANFSGSVTATTTATASATPTAVTAGTGKPLNEGLFSDLFVTLTTGAGSIISPATAGNQTTGNTSLSTIATNSGTQSTAANQTATQGSKAGGTAATNSDLVGGVYNTSLPTLTTGQQASLQFDVNGRLITSAAGGLAQGSTTSGQLGGLMFGAVTTASPTYTTGQSSPFSLDTSGNVRVNVVAGGAGGGAVTIANGADTALGSTTDTAAASGSVTATLIAVNKALLNQAQSTTPVVVNQTQVNGVTLLTGNGTTGTGSQRVTIASDNTAFAVNAAITGTLPAFAAAPTVIISQTTPGTTNGVAIKDTNNFAPDFKATSPTAQVGPYPSLNTAGVVSSATPETCSSGNVANATVACTLAASSGKTTYITGFTMTGDGATVGLAVSCTLTGTITGTMTYTFGYPVGVAVPAQPLMVTFAYPVPASATNTTIVASCPASGLGGTNAAISATGFQL